MLELVLRAYPAAVAVANREGELPLHYAAKHGTVETIKRTAEAWPQAVLEPQVSGALPWDVGFANYQRNPQPVRDMMQAAPTLCLRWRSYLLPCMFGNDIAGLRAAHRLKAALVRRGGKGGGGFDG